MAGRVVAIENSAPQVLPTITSLSVTSGTAGTAVTITGNNFGASPGTVTFNGTAAIPTNWIATTISTTVPVGATTGNVVVTVNSYSSNGVMFAVTAAETVSTPNTPAGPASGFTNAVYTYTASGSVSSYANPVQYIFYWGDGTNSGWLPSGTTAASHAWTSPGTWAVSVQARSAPNPTVVSAFSPPQSVSVISGYANLYISSDFHTYDSWTMSLDTNVHNNSLTLCAIIPNGSQSCTPNWGQTTPVVYGHRCSFAPEMRRKAEWVEFPTRGVRSNDIIFTVSDSRLFRFHPGSKSVIPGRYRSTRAFQMPGSPFARFFRAVARAAHRIGVKQTLMAIGRRPDGFRNTTSVHGRNGWSSRRRLQTVSISR